MEFEEYIIPSDAIIIHNDFTVRNSIGYNFKNVKGISSMRFFYSTKKQYFKDGELHRIDGPAVEYWNGTKFCFYWFYKGKLIECENYEEFKRKIKLLAFI